MLLWSTHLRGIRLPNAVVAPANDAPTNSDVDGRLDDASMHPTDRDGRVVDIQHKVL